jgi:hypothetical protein
MRIDTSGNVGIGVTSPSSKLHVKSTVNDSTNGLTLEYNAGTAYYGRIFSSGNDLTISADTGNTGGTMRLLTGGTERVRIDSSGNFSITQAPGKYTVDVTGGATSIANGATVDFPSASGMLVVNNWLNGAVTIYLCGGGAVTVVSTVIASAGTFAYNSGIGGYTWTNNIYGGTATFGFFFVRTRTTA